MMESLHRYSPESRVWAFCLDDESFQYLSHYPLPGVTPVGANEFETPELLSVKSGRNVAEYCWTCTPSIIDHCLRKLSLGSVIYLDADLFFFSSVEPLLVEFAKSGSSVLLTEHRYTPKYDHSLTSGVYCVQFMGFRHDDRGLAALDWWKARCLEWCFARAEDGKFGDQKYLDDWKTRFPGVHVLQHLGGGVAPWNFFNYDITEGPCVDGTAVVFCHFHALRWRKDGSFVKAEGYRLPGGAKQFIYPPYLEALGRALAQVRRYRLTFDAGLTPVLGWSMHDVLFRIKEWIRA